jgi:hypothetical protein
VIALSVLAVICLAILGEPAKSWKLAHAT